MWWKEAGAQEERNAAAIRVSISAATCCPGYLPSFAPAQARAEILSHVTNGVGGTLYSKKWTALRIAASSVRFRMKG